jgi:ubiquinone/menaquinone biosynthesis C-methylase UbiE
MRQKNLRTASQVRADYDQDGTSYDEVRFGTAGGRYVNKLEHDFVSSFVKGSRVLEVGTSTGRFAVSLTNRGAEYMGVDLSRRMLRTTYERTSHAASLVQMDACKMGLRSYFDYVLCIRTFHFLRKPVDALQGMFDALEPLKRTTC